MTLSFGKSFSTLYSDELLFGVHVCFHVFFFIGGGKGGGGGREFPVFTLIPVIPTAFLEIHLQRSHFFNVAVQLVRS